MKKVKNQKSYFDTFKWTSKESEQLFFMLTQSQKPLPAYTAHTLAKIKLYVSGPNLQKIIFFSVPKSPTYRHFIKIEEIENLTLGHLYSFFQKYKPSRGGPMDGYLCISSSVSVSLFYLAA
jgi:hypothetical protein